MNKFVLEAEFTGFWCGGTGRSGFGDFDSIAYRDLHGCPALPLTQLKGTLRETTETYWGKKRAEEIFGKADIGGESKVEHEGKFRFSRDLLLDKKLRLWFESELAARAQLFRALRFTALENGAAKQDSLRTCEMCVPLKLTTQIEFFDTELILDFAKICALTTALGAFKNDGFGRVILKLFENGSEVLFAGSKEALNA